MIINIIAGVIVLVCLVAIIVIIVKRLKQLAQIDTSNIPKEKQSEVKSSLMEERLERKFKTVGTQIGKGVKPISNKIIDWLKSAREKVISLEKHYRQRIKSKKTPTLEEQESTRQKINKLFTEAEELFKNELWAEAEKKYLEVISLDHKNIEAYQKLGWIYFETKDYIHAKETFEFIKKMNPKDDEVYLGLGEIYISLDKKEEALLNFKEAVRLAPNDPKNLDSLLNLAIEMKDKNLSYSTFDQLKQANSENKKLDEFDKRIKELG